MTNLKGPTTAWWNWHIKKQGVFKFLNVPDKDRPTLVKMHQA